MYNNLFINLVVIINVSQVRTNNGDCITEDFEGNIDFVCNDTTGICEQVDSWQIGTYKDIDLEAPSNNSTRFMSTGNETSCLTTQAMTMVAGGFVEVNTYWEGVQGDMLMVLVIVPGDNEKVLAANLVQYHPGSAGWHETRTQLTEGASEAVIVFASGIKQNSLLLLDSFRYYASPEVRPDCLIYPDDVDNEDSGEVTSTTELSTTEETTGTTDAAHYSLPSSLLTIVVLANLLRSL